MSSAAADSPGSAAPSASPGRRQLRQLGLFFAGASFMAASVAVARRSVLRRRLESLPAFHTSNRLVPKPDASDRQTLALHALGLATLNVLSFGVLLVGGISWAFDLYSVDELRRRTQAITRRSVHVSPEEEREAEEMLRSWLARFGLDKLQDKSFVQEAASGAAPADGHASGPLSQKRDSASTPTAVPS